MIVLPRTDYRVILADPPWDYQNWTKAKNGAAPAHYKTMTTEKLASGLNVSSFAAPDCMLLLWATAPKMEDALQVMAGWGFRYKTVAFTWVKTYADGSPYCGLGFYTRSATEFCLLGTRGRPSRRSASVRQVITAPVGRHSAKPMEQYQRIGDLMDGPYCELFARERWPGWDAWGNEV